MTATEGDQLTPFNADDFQFVYVPIGVFVDEDGEDIIVNCGAHPTPEAAAGAVKKVLEISDDLTADDFVVQQILLFDANGIPVGAPTE